MNGLRQIARAKINLTLHVQPVNDHGYHSLHSLVVFADIGDVVTAKPAHELSLLIDGKFAKGLPKNRDNLVFRAALAGAQCLKIQTKYAFTLTKNLPVSSGIGGGSADAAAVIRILHADERDVPCTLDTLLLDLGADVPVCYGSKTCIMEGVGEKITPLHGLGKLHAVLVNPAVAVSTAHVFKGFDAGQGGSQAPQTSGASLLEMAQAGRNDLQDIAIGLTPIIRAVLDEISGQDLCQLARMSGSGATCFGIFKTRAAARAAAQTIQKNYPDWWCVAAVLGDLP